MSEEQNTYDPRYIQLWSLLSIVLGLLFLSLFIFGDQFLHLGHIIWSLLRWLCRGII